MTESESEVSAAQLNTIKEADEEELLKRELWERPEVLELVVERKKRKFTRSGLVLMIIGVILIAPSLLLNTGANSIEGLLVGVGVLLGFSGF
jgi:hypothetical protein